MRASAPSADRAFLLLRGEQLVLLRGVPAGCSYALRLLQNSTLSSLRNRFSTANNYAVNLQRLFRDDSSSNELSLPLTLITLPVSYSGREQSPLPSRPLNIKPHGHTILIRPTSNPQLHIPQPEKLPIDLFTDTLPNKSLSFSSIQ